MGPLTAHELGGQRNGQTQPRSCPTTAPTRDKHAVVPFAPAPAQPNIISDSHRSRAVAHLCKSWLKNESNIDLSRPCLVGAEDDGMQKEENDGDESENVVKLQHDEHSGEGKNTMVADTPQSRPGGMGKGDLLQRNNQHCPAQAYPHGGQCLSLIARSVKQCHKVPLSPSCTMPPLRPPG